MLEFNLRFQSSAFFLLSSSVFSSLVQSICNPYTGCDFTPVSYNVKQKKDLPSVSKYINTSTSTSTSNIIKYIPNTLEKTSHERHPNVTTAKQIQSVKSYDFNPLPDTGIINVRDISVSKNNGFLLRSGTRRNEDFTWVANSEKHSGLNQSSKHVNFSLPYDSGLAYLPTQDENVNDPPLKTCSGLSDGAIVGITIGVVAVMLVFARCLYNRVYRNKNAEISSALLKNAQIQLTPAQAPNGSLISGSEPCGVLGGLEGITLTQSIEFSYEELSKATHGFGLCNKIGQGGFGSVYYAELRGKKAAIKKMDMQASKEFLAELKVLTRVHHVNLVRLIGYCVKGSHFLVYEYIENGNLSQHIHGSGKDPLPWSTRVQIALDSARGLEYIHEYTISVFIHCDIKSENILIDKNFHGKVADFGLTRLTEVGSRSRFLGTFGYMSPEYAQYGDVSPKVDVYAFGVVLYELISAKKAVVRANGPAGEPKGLVSLFKEVFSGADPKDDLIKMIDPKLGDNYPLDSVHKMAQLAKTCTHEDPQQRPSMRSIVVELMTLSPST